ncbi:MULTISPECIES: GNAT family N-acetyltransferase [Flavobacterium]|uniref:N(6)-hydroxylysine O-acetyltransferase n=2 Tax=Flavobacterium TaxID=237 RepID=A0A2N9P9D5_9FLAO|nr:MULTISPECIES: GNAT family N-acetyltransferase [Flavobacterium]QYS89548.1 acetyltransferase [Flavobacterium davisii]RVU91726.1 N-acetyltransferase [Flavobacterium columnare]SPE76945.1 N(6)-hydroxylysine O-acetyltransferase [Flavobacterium columnare]
MNSTQQSNQNIENQICFSKKIESIGFFELRKFNLTQDLPIIYQWVQKEYAIYWGMMGLQYNEVKTIYQKLVENTHIYIGLFQGKIAFLLECYDPQEDIIKEHYEVKKGDIGMHILVAPPDKKINGFTWQIFKFILDFIFSNSTINRVVVEPDAKNEKIHILNEKAGFVFQKFIDLPHKKARLEFCTRQQYYHAIMNSN